MKNYIKCTNCGSTDFVRKTYYTENQIDAGYFSLQGVNTYVCQKCGHVEFFDAALDAYAHELFEIEKREQEKMEAEKIKKIKDLKNEIIKTQSVIDDLDSTQRQVAEAKEKLEELKEEYLKITGHRYGTYITSGA